jgi:TolC family type I secretion outer membrane protein
MIYILRVLCVSAFCLSAFNSVDASQMDTQKEEAKKENYASFREAMVSAYNTNSNLRSDVMRQRAQDEAIPQARAGFLPTLNLTGQAGKEFLENQNIRTSPPLPTDPAKRRVRTTSSPINFGATLSQPIYSGGSTLADVDAAESGVRAGQFTYTAAEQKTFTDAVSAYADVIFRIAVIKSNEGNKNFLKEQFDSVTAEADAGDKTATDIAQANGAFAEAEANLIAARGDYANSVATYVNVIGEEPKLLGPPMPLQNLPKTRQEVIDLAQERNPAVLTALYNHKQAIANIDSAFGTLLPQVNLNGSAQRFLEPQTESRRQNDFTATLSATVPIYQAGRQTSLTRQRTEQAAQARFALAQARKDARSAAIQAWESWLKAKEQITAFKEQIKAEILARDGAILESEVGEKPYLDVLDGQRRLLAAEVNLAQAIRDEIIAEYTMLAAVGGLTVEYLNLPVERYDIEKHYEETRGKLWGFSHIPKNLKSETAG